MYPFKAHIALIIILNFFSGRAFSQQSDTALFRLGTSFYFTSDLANSIQDLKYFKCLGQGQAIFDLFKLSNSDLDVLSKLKGRINRKELSQYSTVLDKYKNTIIALEILFTDTGARIDHKSVEKILAASKSKCGRNPSASTLEKLIKIVNSEFLLQERYDLSGGSGQLDQQSLKASSSKNQLSLSVLFKRMQQYDQVKFY